jgi:hypothetical protein
MGCLYLQSFVRTTDPYKLVGRVRGHAYMVCRPYGWSNPEYQDQFAHTPNCARTKDLLSSLLNYRQMYQSHEAIDVLCSGNTFNLSRMSTCICSSKPFYRSVAELSSRSPSRSIRTYQMTNHFGVEENPSIQKVRESCMSITTGVIKVWTVEEIVDCFSRKMSCLQNPNPV